MIHTYLCRAPRTTTTGSQSTIVSAAPPPFYHQTNPLPDSSLFPSCRLAPLHLGPSLSLLHGTLPLTLLAEDQASRQGAIGLRSVWVANQAAKVRIPSTRRFHVAVEKRHEDATWDESVRISPPAWKVERFRTNAAGAMAFASPTADTNISRLPNFHHVADKRLFPVAPTFKQRVFDYPRRCSFRFGFTVAFPYFISILLSRFFYRERIQSSVNRNQRMLILRNKNFWIY